MKNLNILLFLFLSIAVGCSKDSASPGDVSSTGIGGSTSRFAIKDNTLYVVDHTNLHLFDISNPAKPQALQDATIGELVETIFVKGNYMFIGSANGMLIFDITSPQLVKRLGSVYREVLSCDPVVTDSAATYAYVTLHSENSICMRGSNELNVIDLHDILNPAKIRTYQLQNPRGLGVNKKRLYVCDNGLSYYDIVKPDSLVYKGSYLGNFSDVIPLENELLAIGSNGLYQYAYSPTGLTFLSLISTNQ